jgi:putative oxidoreductase
MSKNGYEYALTLLVVAVSLVFSGAGSYSVDKVISAK